MPADLVAAKRQVVDAVEQDRQAVGGGDRGEERIEPGLDRVLAKDALGDLLVGADPELLVRVRRGWRRPGREASPRPARVRQTSEDPLGPDAVLDQRGEAADQRLGAPGSGGAGDQQRSRRWPTPAPERRRRRSCSLLHPGQP